MKITFLVHSMLSCWNNGNAHFQRGVASALQALGHQVQILEPVASWSRSNLLADAGEAALDEFRETFPELRPVLYRTAADAMKLIDASQPDLVIVHEWNDPELVNGLGARRKAEASFVLLFHDTHHRAVTRPQEMAQFDLDGYDGVLAFGATVADVYRRRGWGRQVWIWHEAADIRRFGPLPGADHVGDLVWVGNWGDHERTQEITEFLQIPSQRLGLETTVYGVRYPQEALDRFRSANITYGGRLANHRVAEVFSRYRATVHIPRRPYARMLRGIPTIRMFEALACAIPCVSAPWADDESLFDPGSYLMARDGEEMQSQLRAVLSDPDLAQSLRSTGLQCILARHTCDHRADELLQIYASISQPVPKPALKRAI